MFLRLRSYPIPVLSSGHYTLRGAGFEPVTSEVWRFINGVANVYSKRKKRPFKHKQCNKKLSDTSKAVYIPQSYFPTRIFLNHIFPTRIFSNHIFPPHIFPNHIFPNLPVYQNSSWPRAGSWRGAGRRRGTAATRTAAASSGA